MTFESDLLRDSASRLFADLFDKPTLDARPKPDAIGAVWQKFEDAGLPFAAVSEDHGGVGASLADVMALVRLTGLHAVPAPLAESIMAGWVWSSLAKSAPPAGPITMASSPMVSSPSLGKVAGGWQLDAEIERVPWGKQCKAILFPCTLAGQAVLVMAPLDAATTSAAGTNMALEPRNTLAFAATPLSASAVIDAGTSPGPTHIDEVLALTRAAQLSGAMAAALDRTINYANERVQFGRPIAKFQAVQQQLALAAGEVAATQAAVDLAVSLAADTDKFAIAAAIAKARASEAAGIVASVCHQTHAAIGFTNEHPLQLYTRRLWSWRDEAGNETHWHRLLGERLLAAGPQKAWPLLASLTPGA